MPASRRILVVDDDPYTRDLAGTALRGQGYEVMGAARLSRGLEAARAQRPELVLCDVVLPDGSGIDLARALQDEFPRQLMPVVILMSAFSKGRLADQRNMREQAGAVAFLTKPLSIPYLLDLVAQQLPLSAEGREPPAPPDPDTTSLMRGPEAPGGEPQASGAEPQARAVGPAAPAEPAATASAAAARPPSRSSAEPAPAAHALLAALASAWRKGWTGTLVITRSSGEKPIEKHIGIERGQIVWAKTSLTDEKLGRVLLRLGWLPRDQYESTLKDAARTGRRHGAILLEHGFVTAQQLEDALLQQVELIVLGALGWPEGTYRIAARTSPPEMTDRVAARSIPQLVVRAFRETIGAERLDARLAAAGDRLLVRRPEVPAAAVAQLAAGPEEARILDALVTPASLDRVLGAHPEGREAARPFLGALLALGIIAPAIDVSQGGAAGRAEDQPHGPAPVARAGPPTEPPRRVSAPPGKGSPHAPAGQAPAAPPAPDPAERLAAEEAARRLLEAEAAFDAGRRAAERGDLAAAAAALRRAVSLCPDEGEYRAWAAWIDALAARAQLDRALDTAAAEMQAAAGLTPSSEAIFELIERVMRLRTSPGGAEWT